jgi:hypothetical protein
VGRRKIERQLPSLGFHHAIAVVPERHADESPHLRLVLDDEDERPGIGHGANESMRAIDRAGQCHAPRDMPQSV